MRAPGDETALNMATVSGQAGDLLSDFCGAIAGFLVFQRSFLRSSGLGGAIKG